GFSILRFIPIAMSSLWLALTVFWDARTWISSPLIVGSELLCAISIAVIFGSIVAPLLIMSYWSRRWIWPRNNPYSQESSQLQRFAVRLLVPLFVAGGLGFFFLFERLLPCSVLPFSTTICAVLWLIGGNWMIKRSGAQARAALLAMGVLMILSVKFLDWN